MRRLLAAATAISMLAGAARAETLTIATHYTDAQLAPLTACFRTYEAQHPGLKIVHQQSAIADYLQGVLTSRLAGTSPDIYNVYTVWGAQLVDNGVLAKPPADMAQFITDSYLPNVLDTVKVGGAVWGIPTEISAYMLIYNKKLFRAAGLSAPPGDWGEVLADAAKLTQHNGAGRITTAGFVFGPTVANAVHPYLALLASRGFPLLTADGKHTNLTRPAAADVLDAERQLFVQGSTDNSLQVRDFPSGAVGMMIYANWDKQTLHDAFGFNLDDTVGVAPIPAGPDWKTLSYGFFWAVDANSPHQADAWALLRWLNTPRGEGQRSCTGDFLATLGALTGNKADIAASPGEYGDKFSKPFVDAISSGRAVGAPNVLHATEIQQDLNNAIRRAWSGAQTPAEALAQADKEIRALLAE